MSETLKACPACGGEAEPPDRATDLYYSVCCNRTDCWMEGPLGVSAEEAIERWNTLPRWDWRPASEKPVVPEGKTRVAVWGWFSGTVNGHPGVAVYGEGEWMEPYPSHWMPLPPGPTEGGPR